MNCCKKTNKLLKRLYEAMDVDELLDNKFIIPNRLMAVGAEGTSEYTSYLELTQALIKIIDHLGVHPVVEKTTTDDGDEIVGASVNATAAIQSILSTLSTFEQSGDNTANLEARTAIAASQILKTVSIINNNLESLIEFVGTPVNLVNFDVEMPLNPTLEGIEKATVSTRKGFGKSPPQKGKKKDKGGKESKDKHEYQQDPETIIKVLANDSKQKARCYQLADRDTTLIDIIGR